MEENFSSLSLGKVGWLVELALGRACGSRDGDRRSDPRCALRGDIFEEAISAHVCVDAWILSSLFLSSSLSPSLSLSFYLCLFFEWKRLRYRGVRATTNRCNAYTFTFHPSSTSCETAAWKRARVRGRERERGMGGGEWANCIPVSERARGMGLRGCISCLLPGRKPPTKTLMSNVSGDNANPTPLSRSFHDHRVCSNWKTSEEEFSSFERTRIRDKESFCPVSSRISLDGI